MKRIGTTNAVDTTTPLTNEELAALFVATNENNKEENNKVALMLANALTKVIESNQSMFNQFSISISELNTTIKESIKSQTEQNKKHELASITEPVPVNPLFSVCTKNKTSNMRRNWINKSKGIIAMLIERTDINEGNIYNEIYSLMKEKDNYDVGLLFDEYKKINPDVKTKLEMCAASDPLAISFEGNINRFFYSKVKKHKVDDITKEMLGSDTLGKDAEITQLAKTCMHVEKVGKNGKTKKYYLVAYQTIPAEITEAVKKFAKKSVISSKDYKNAYKYYSNKRGVDLTKYNRDVMAKYNLPTSTVGFSITLDPELKQDFINTVSNC